MEVEEDRDDASGVAARPMCDASMPLLEEPRLPLSDLPPNPCDGSEEISEGANEWPDERKSGERKARERRCRVEGAQNQTFVKT